MNMRTIFWALACVCLLSGLVAPAATTANKQAVKGKSPAVPAKKAIATKESKAGNKAAVKAPVATAKHPAARGVQPTNTRYNTAANSRTRRPQVATSRGYVRPKVYAPPVQMLPSQDRYREIQNSLAQKGYLRSEPNGAWDGDTVDAMKRFQHDQNLDADGKINSLSLIALGLGPKRVVSASTLAPAVANPQPPTVNPPQRP